MARFCFTGNPFVDAGIAGMCAAAGVDSLVELDETSVDRAVNELMRVMTDDAAFRRRLLGKKETAFATSEMSVIFPNGPHSQASYKTSERKRDEYKKRVTRKLVAFNDLVKGQTLVTGLGFCFVDGSPAVTLVGNDEFPLVDSKNKRNFHPGLQGGHAVGALTALALEFFPLAILRTGVNSGFFFFIHTADSGIAIDCSKMTLGWMNGAIARGGGLGFFGDWKLPSRDVSIALVALVRTLMTGTNTTLTRQRIEASLYPVAAYVFSNDNRGANIAAHDLPHLLFGYFGKLRYRLAASEAFNKELLQNEKIAGRIAKRMLLTEPMIALCCVRPDGERHGKLRGGWEAHMLYATEVLGMGGLFVRDVETVSERITSSEKANGMLLILQKEGPSSALLRLVRNELMTFDEYARLVPPHNKSAPFTARDYLLAAVYARQASQADGEEFVNWSTERTGSTQDKHELILLAERVGSKLAADADLAKKSANGLAGSRRVSDFRGALLRTVRSGILNWNDFVQIFPPDDQSTSFLMRDYLLAFLYDALRDPEIADPDEIIEKIEV
jgi:CRISPR-associated protein Cst1